MDDRIVIGDKELTLLFDTAAFVDLEKAFGSLDRMYKMFDEDIMPMTTGLRLAAICATSGTATGTRRKRSPSPGW